jgi:hypothetical protein
MNNAQNTKNVVILAPGTAATNATATVAVVDTKGWDYAKVKVQMAAATATNSSAKFITLELQEGDTTSSFSAITGATGTTNSTASSSQFVLPVNNNTSVGQAISFYVDLKARKRYLNLSITPPASHTTLAATCDLSKGETLPDSATERGDAASVIV